MRHVCLSLFALLLATACGGGGSGSTGPATNPGPGGLPPVGLPTEPTLLAIFQESSHEFVVEHHLATDVIRVVSGSGFGPFGEVDALAADPTTGVIYGADNQNDLFIAIDPVDLLPTAIAPMGDESVEGLAWVDPEQALYGCTETELFRFDPVAGTLTMVGFLGPDELDGLTYDAATDTLYGSSDQTDAVYVVDRQSGAATPHMDLTIEIDDALAFHPPTGHLVFFDEDHEGYVRVDPATGQVTAAAGGVPQDVSGLTWDAVGNRMLGVNDENQLITVDVTAGTGTLASLLEIEDLVAMAFDSSTNTVYAGSEDQEGLFRVDTRTGRAHLIGLHEGQYLQAMAYHPGTDTLWGIETNGPSLVEVDRTTGALTVRAGLASSTLSGLAIDPVNGVFYGVDHGTQELVEIDPNTGATSLIAPLPASEIRSLTFDPGSDLLLFASAFTGVLYSLDPVTLVPGVVGYTGSAELGALALDTVQGRLFGSDKEYDGLVELDRTTGAVATIGCARWDSAEDMAWDDVAQHALVAEGSGHSVFAWEPRGGTTRLLARPGLHDIRAMARHPLTGVILAAGFDEAHALHRIDPVTGAILDQRPLSHSLISAMTWNPTGTVLFGSSTFNDTLFRIDPLSGVCTPIGDLDSNTVTGLAFDDAGALFGIDRSTGNLLRVDPGTGATAVVGPTGMSGPEELVWDGARQRLLATGAGTGLYDVNRTTGVATEIGLAATSLKGLVFDSSQDAYVGIAISGEVWQVDGTTLASTWIARSGTLGLEAIAVRVPTQEILVVTENTPWLSTLQVATEELVGFADVTVDRPRTLASAHADGRLFGAAPGGVIFEMDPVTGASTVVFPFPTLGIDALARHPVSGQLFAHYRGELFEVDPDSGDVGPAKAVPYTVEAMTIRQPPRR